MFTVAFVCTGNRCRSALAQGLIEKKTRGLPVRASSCGTLDIEGARSPRETLQAARALGVDLSAHRSRHFLGCDLASCDLVLGFEFDHVARAVVEGGARQETTFLFPELIRLLDGVDAPPAADPVARARDLIAAANARRKAEPRFVPSEQVPDPIGQPPNVHLHTAEGISSLCDRLVAALFPSGYIRHDDERA